MQKNEFYCWAVHFLHLMKAQPILKTSQAPSETWQLPTWSNPHRGCGEVQGVLDVYFGNSKHWDKVAKHNMCFSFFFPSFI